jgi:hypothetical protein
MHTWTRGYGTGAGGGRLDLGEMGWGDGEMILQAQRPETDRDWVRLPVERELGAGDGLCPSGKTRLIIIFRINKQVHVRLRARCA